MTEMLASALKGPVCLCSGHAAAPLSSILPMALEQTSEKEKRRKWYVSIYDDDFLLLWIMRGINMFPFFLSVL